MPEMLSRMVAWERTVVQKIEEKKIAMTDASRIF
jgi:hypothetical protein